MSLAAHEYHFALDCRVAESDLLPVTLESLEQTNVVYVQNRARYFGETYDAIRADADGPYALLRKPGDSTTDALVTILPFGTRLVPPHSPDAMTERVTKQNTKRANAVNPNDANKLLQSRFLYDTMRLAGIHDKEGKPLPVLVVSPPCLDHRNTLTRQERRMVSRGDFTPFARRVINKARTEGYHRLHAAGYSLGSIAVSTVELAGEMDVDILSGSYVGDAPHFKSRRPYRIFPLGIAPPYMLDSVGTKYNGEWPAANGLLPRSEGFYSGEGYSPLNWVGNGNALANLALVKGLSVDGLSSAFRYMNQRGIPGTVSWSDSRLMRGFDHYISTQSDAVDMAYKGLLRLFHAVDVPHLSGENGVFLTDVMIRSMQHAQNINQAA